MTKRIIRILLSLLAIIGTAYLASLGAIGFVIGEMLVFRVLTFGAFVLMIITIATIELSIGDK